MDQFVSVPVNVWAERWNGIETYGGLISNVWSTHVFGRPIQRGVLAHTFRRLTTQVISEGDWIVVYPSGICKSFTESDFAAKFRRA